MVYPTRQEYLQVSGYGPGDPLPLPQGSIKDSSRKWMSIICLFMGMIIGALLASATGIVLSPRQCRVETTQNTYTVLPELEMNTTVEFSPDYSYWNMSNFESEQAWAPLGRHGGIFIHDPQQFGLLPGIETSSDYESFPVSVFHQLHCLKTVRAQLASLVNGWSVDDPLAFHADHCFDYLRQNIMCAADLTLEKARVDPDGHRRATDGWGTIHHCKDWDKVMETMVEYRFKHAS